ncbi:hypothetical protein BGW80DRAFT_688297 [Lactifluus volemus]|nr:hypothetical protein BGW80DRAFT_688297 [Lactifluus volemus]
MLTKETNVPYFQRGAPKNGICFDDSFLPKFYGHSPPQTSSGSQTVGLTSFFFFFHGLPPWQMSHHTESPFPVPPPSPNAVWLRYSSQIELFLLLRNLPGSTIDPPPSCLLASPPLSMETFVHIFCSLSIQYISQDVPTTPSAPPYLSCSICVA